MSRCAIYLRGRDVKGAATVAVQLGLLAAGAKSDRVAAEQSEIVDDEVGIAVSNGWGVLFLDSGPLLDDDITSKLSAASAGIELFFWLTQSASGGLWFEYHRDGRLLRKWIEVESEVHENVGDPLPQEPADFFTSEPDDERIRDESRVLELAAAVTGVSDETLFEMPFEVYRR